MATTLTDRTGHGGRQRDRPGHHGGPGGPGAARRPGRPRSREARASPGGPGARPRLGVRGRLRHQRPVRRQGGGRPGPDRLRQHRRAGLQRRDERQEPQPRVARPRRLGPDDRHQPHRRRSTWSTPCSPRCGSRRTAWSSRSARSRASAPARSAAPATRPRSSARRPWASAWDARKARGASARRSSIPARSNTPILDARPVPVGAERRAVDPPARGRRRRRPLPGRAPPPRPRPRAGHQAHRGRLLLTQCRSCRSRLCRRSDRLGSSCVGAGYAGDPSAPVGAGREGEPGASGRTDRRHSRSYNGSRRTGRHPFEHQHTALDLDLAGRVLVELGVEQVAVELALGLELRRRAGVLDPAVVQDDD